MMKYALVTAILLFAAFAAVDTNAQPAAPSSVSDEPELNGFKSPSKNIHCQLFKMAGEEAVLRCDILKFDNRPPPRPRDCDLDWGQAFEVSGSSNAARICHGDAVMDERLLTLQYGELWQRDGFRCKSEQSGITCSNTAGRGFVLSRGSQTLF